MKSKADILKRIIKEACREVFQEEMKVLLLEALKSQSKSINESHTPMGKQIMNEPPASVNKLDINKIKAMMMGGEGEGLSKTTNNTNPLQVIPGMNTAGEGSSLPAGDVDLGTIGNFLNK